MSPQPRPASTSGADLELAFTECFSSMLTLGRQLSEDEWNHASLCPGWSCKDALVHVTSAETAFADWTPSPEPPMAAIMEIGRMLRRQSGADVLGAFEAITNRRAEQLRNMTEAAFDAVGWSPAGMGPYRRYMEIRVFDHWAHEQDIRVPLNRPGHLEGRGPTMSLNEAHIAFGYLFGKRAAAPEGASVTVHVTGSIERDLHAAVEGRAKILDELHDPTCSVSTDFATFMLLCCGRIDPELPLRDGRVTIAGDTDLATRVALSLAFTI